MEFGEAELCFPRLLNASCKKPNVHYSDSEVIVYVVLSFISLLTAALNLLLIISISHFRQLHSSTNFILLSLAVSDFFIGIVVIPVESLMTTSCWYLSDLLCALYFHLPVTLVSASVANMVLISVDRYVAICYPLHYATIMTVSIVSFGVGLCWIGSFFYSVLLLHENLKHPGQFNSCVGECVINMMGEVDLIVNFILPVSIIIILYMRVFVVVVSQARAMRSHTAVVTLSPSVTVTAKKSEVKAARTLGVVVLVFLFCYIPYYCVALSGGDIMVGSPLEAFIAFILYINSCINPLIYACLYPWFRKAVKVIVTLQILQSDSCYINVL